MLLIDKLSYSSRLRYKSPSLKAFFAVSTLLLCVAARSVLFSLFVLILMGSLTVFIGGTSPSYYIKLMRVPLAFLLLSTLTILFGIALKPTEQPFVKLLFLYVYLEKDKLILGLRLILSALGAVSCLYFLSLTTPFTDLIKVLNRLHFPAILTELLLLIYRYIFVLYETASGIAVAQESRLLNRNFRSALKGSSGLFATLFIRAMKKSSLLYDAMEARCYDGTIKVLWEKDQANRKEIILVVLFEAAMLVSSLYLKRF